MFPQCESRSSSKSTSSVFPLLDFKICPHSQFLKIFIEKVLFCWRGCQLFWIHGSWVEEISWSPSHGQFHMRLPTEDHLCVLFLNVAALRTNWAGLICARVVWSRSGEAASTSAKRNFLNNLCSIRPAKEYVALSEVASHCAFDRMPACHEVGGRPYPNNSPSVLESVHPLMKLSNDFQWRGTLSWISC